MRNLLRSEEFDAFYESLDYKVKEKVDYSTKFVKRLEGTDFYEMRISVNNEYRVIIFTLDDENFIAAKNVLLLNGFTKKSTSDYKPQIKIAEKILIGYSK